MSTEKRQGGVQGTDAEKVESKEHSGWKDVEEGRVKDDA